MFKRINNDLKSLLGEELVKQLETVLKDKDVVLELADEFIPKERFNQVNEQLKDYKTKFESTNSELEKFKPLAAGNEALTKQIAELQASNEKVKTEYEQKMVAREKDFAITNYLRDQKVSNITVAMKLLDTTNVQLKDGKLVGLDEQIATMKKDPSLTSLFGMEQTKVDSFGNPIVQNNLPNGMPSPESPEYLTWRKTHNPDGTEIK